MWIRHDRNWFQLLHAQLQQVQLEPQLLLPDLMPRRERGKADGLSITTSAALKDSRPAC